MIGIIIVAHGNLAQAFLQTMEMIIGPQEGFEIISIDSIDKFEQARQDLEQAIRRVDSGSGVIILTDMFGGTPSNLSLSFLKEKKIEVVTGINLPMLLKLPSLRESHELEDLKTIICRYGREKIVVASDLLSHNKGAE
ncbi:MAG: PTS sugar transporter subunit IIA [bacterium]